MLQQGSPLAPHGSDTRLPTEIICHIISEADLATLAQLRLSCKWLAHEAAKYLFAIASVELREKSMERLIEGSKTPVIAAAVKILVVKESARLPDLTFPEFKKAIVQDDEVFQKNSGAIENEEYWQNLYGEYLDELMEEPFFNAFASSGPLAGAGEATRLATTTGLTHQRTRLESAILGFDEALLRFANLQQVEASRLRDHGEQPIKWKKRHFRSPLTHAPFYGFGSDRGPAYEAAYTTFTLRTLGWRSHFSASLTSLKLELVGDSWWGPLDLDTVWPIYAQRSAIPGESRQLTWSGLNGQKQLVGDAFRHLINLQLSVYVKAPVLLSTATVVTGWLSKARQLERLNFKLLPVGDYTETAIDQDVLYRVVRTPEWALNGVVPRAYFPRLRELQLSTIVTEKSLLTLLSLSSHTLQSIHLEGCVLSSVQESWPRILRSVQRIPFKQLRHFNFSACVDFDPSVPGLDPDQARQKIAEDGRVGEELPGMMSYCSLSVVDDEYLMEKGFLSGLQKFMMKETDTMPEVYRY